MNKAHSIHVKLIKAIDLFKSGKSYEIELKAINQDHEAVLYWIYEYGMSFDEMEPAIDSDSIFESVIDYLQDEIEHEDNPITPNTLLALIREKISNTESYIHVCNVNEAVVVFHGSPAGMDLEYSDLAIYKNMNEFYEVYSQCGWLFPGKIHSDETILSMFLRHLVTASIKKFIFVD